MEVRTSGSSLTFQNPELRFPSLDSWLHEVYFDDDDKAYFSKADIESASAFIQSMMQLRPSDRAQVSELINQDPLWLDDGSW